MEDHWSAAPIHGGLSSGPSKGSVENKACCARGAVKPRASCARRRRAPLIGRIYLVFCFFLVAVGSLLLSYRYWEHARAGSVSGKAEDILAGAFPGDGGPDETSDAPEMAQALDEMAEVFSNPDVVAYLKVPDMDIGYPVMHGTDNDFYLYHDAYGNWSINGSIFLDYSCRGDFSQQTNVLYGHHMYDGAMFGWMEGTYAQSIAGRYFMVYTRDKAYRYDILCTVLSGAYDEQVYLLDPGETMEEFWSKLKDRSVDWNADVPYSTASKVCSLMTCYGDGSRYRFGVVGVLRDSGNGGI